MSNNVLTIESTSITSSPANTGFELYGTNEVACTVEDWGVGLLDDLRATHGTGDEGLDNSTYAHCLRVGDSAYEAARVVGLPEIDRRKARVGAIAHDIGKSTMKRIIDFPGRMDNEMRATMDTHAERSQEYILANPIPIEAAIELTGEGVDAKELTREMGMIVLNHHNASGVIEGMGANSVLIKDIIVIADIFDAIMQKSAQNKEEAERGYQKARFAAEGRKYPPTVDITEEIVREKFADRLNGADKNDAAQIEQLITSFFQYMRQKLESHIEETEQLIAA